MFCLEFGGNTCAISCVDVLKLFLFHFFFADFYFTFVNIIIVTEYFYIVPTFYLLLSELRTHLCEKMNMAHSEVVSFNAPEAHSLARKCFAPLMRYRCCLHGVHAYC